MEAKRMKITKLRDNFEGKHPNQINEGFIETGVMYEKPVVGHSFKLGRLFTSTVTEIIDDNTFKTLNSTYKLEPID